MFNNLFNKSTINEFYNKFNKEFKIRNEHKEAINSWNKKLIGDELVKERANYTNFANIILNKLLGFNEDDFKQDETINGNFADFIIFKEDNPYIIIELKGSKKDLDKKIDGENAVDQGFRYAKSFETVEWVIISNYDEFRLYNKKTDEKHVSFKFEDLSSYNDNTIKFLFLFSKLSLIEKSIPDDLYKDTVFIEQELESEFYKLFNETRLMLIEEIQYSNDLNKLTSIHLAQIILNRFIFICFAEDLGLLPAETSTKTLMVPIENSNVDKNTLYRRLDELFRFVNEGQKYKGIPAYNGGLFKKDLRKESNLKSLRDIVEDRSFFDDCIQNWRFKNDYSEKIDEKIGSIYKDIINPIYKNLLLISSFDFASDLDVNILGHIFENSIGELEALKNDESSQRKKHGIFYTPEFITELIAKDTIIPYLSKNDVNNLPDLIKEYENSLEELENKLKNIKIIDIACGSGAFINKACDVLMEIYKAIYDKKSENKQSLSYLFDDVESKRQILLNNIYGVDLNEESVEITKLALFLKVAKKELQLPNLDNNIKTGNSIVDNIKFAGIKEFKWEKQFKEIINNGGFDIVIGNPPYVRQERIKEIKPYLKENYATYTGVADLYVYFFEKSINLLKEGGYLGFICSNKYTRANYGKKLREFLLNYNITHYNDYTGKKVFEGATVDPSVIIINKSKNKADILIDDDFYMDQNRLDDGSWSFERPEILDLRDKIKNKGTMLKDIEEISINRGVTTGCNEAFIIDKKTRDELIAKDPKNIEIIKQLLRGKDVQKWQIDFHDLYLIFTRRELNIDEYPIIKEFLFQFKEDLTPKNEGQKIGRKPGKYEWYEIQDNTAYYKEFEKPKIIWSEIVSTPSFTLDLDKYFLLNTSYILTLEEKEYNISYLLALFNSKILQWYFTKIASSLGNKGVRYIKQFVEQLPIVSMSKKQQKPFIDLVSTVMVKNKQLNNEIASFHNYLKFEFNITNINKKLTKFHELSFEEFYKEIKKQNKNINSKDLNKLKTEFENVVKEINDNLKIEIAKLEKEINEMVYNLYDLTDEEIAIIEYNT